MIYNSYGRTNMIVMLSRCLIAHHLMKAYGKADFMLHAFLTSIGAGEEW